MSAEFVICGLEHTGTTLISDLFRQIPGVDAGFEVGVLLCQSPRDFPDKQPFARNMLAGWGISREELEMCCDTDDFKEFYTRLKAASTVLPEGTTRIFDKTPRYLSQLKHVLGRIDCPIIVSYKDPRAIVYSDFKRAKTDDFLGWYAEYKRPKLRYVKSCYDQHQQAKGNERVLFVPLEELAMNSRQMMEAMFAHVGEAFHLDYAILKDLRYRNTRNNVVSADVAFEFFTRLSPEQQRMIESDFAECDAWFYR